MQQAREKFKSKDDCTCEQRERKRKAMMLVLSFFPLDIASSYISSLAHSYYSTYFG
jgi:hypothetical protein